MASNKGGLSQDFNFIKLIVSEYFDDRNLFGMLMVLYKDSVKEHRLLKVKSTLDLLNALDESDELNVENLTILYDTINLTEQYRLQREIQERFPSFPNVKGKAITRFTIYRQKIVRFGLGLVEKDVTTIDGLFNSTPKRYTDSWAMIRHLEHKQIITETGLNDFIFNLERLGLRQAVLALKKDYPQPCGGPKDHLVIQTTTATSTTDTTRTVTKPKYELSSMDYSQLLVDASKCWKRFGNKYMLKVLLCDFKISITTIQDTDDIFELFKLLQGSGKINTSNIDAIAEAADLCGVGAMEDVIKKSIPAYPPINGEINQFTKYRQNVIEFGHIVSKQNLKTIINVYDLDLDQEKDHWGIILELEINNILTPKQKESFVEKLKANEMMQEVEALETHKK